MGVKGEGGDVQNLSRLLRSFCAINKTRKTGYEGGGGGMGGGGTS